jgi:hypothetical protein
MARKWSFWRKNETELLGTNVNFQEGTMQTKEKSSGDYRVEAGIDRKNLVARHNPVIRTADRLSPLSVGNGRFAFTADITGLQSFFEFYDKSMPLGTLSDWGWHSFPNPEGFQYAETCSGFESHGRSVPYPGREPKEGRAQRAWHWFRENPHRLHLGQIGMRLLKLDGSVAKIGDLNAIEQRLDMWRGVIISRFQLEGKETVVETICHPDSDTIAVRIESALLAEGRLKIFWRFPYGTGAMAAADWDKPDRHSTTPRHRGGNRTDLERRLDGDSYHAAIQWTGTAKLLTTSQHEFTLVPGATGSLEFVTGFALQTIGRLPSTAETAAASEAYWNSFWSKGGAIDLSDSKDPRWHTLERRIILSQYLTAIQCCGSNPPQESGLTHNSWFGKFHLEMTAWHGVHFALWGREHLLERFFDWYTTTGLKAARARAGMQGYSGARWNKMIDGKGSWESPSATGAFRTTQQGHAIYIPELLYRTKRSKATLEKYRDVVFESAEFMASFAAQPAGQSHYVLGPPIISGAEATRHEAFNPALELSYWAFGLSTAQQWRERLGLAREPKWDHVLNNLAPLPQREDSYFDTESHPLADGRPALIEMYGCMPGTNVDRSVMDRTYLRLKQRLQNPHNLWGCDFPMFAMCAARLGRPHEAIDCLLEENTRNVYLPNGHMMQREDLPVYLPANGGLLWAVALMVAGWEGGPAGHAPGFPSDGSWKIRHEGLHAAI